MSNQNTGEFFKACYNVFQGCRIRIGYNTAINDGKIVFGILKGAIDQYKIFCSSEKNKLISVTF